MNTFTSSHPDYSLLLFKEKLKQPKLPKRELVNRVEYILSFNELNTDSSILSIAEEGVDDYFNQLEE